MLKPTNCLFIICLLAVTTTHARQSLLDELEKETEPTPVFSTFKGTRIILGHSIETKKKGELDFLISHRFGRINTGAHELFGLDGAEIRLGLTYGITDRLNIGVGRSSYDKTFDLYAKYRLLVQKTEGMPISVTAFASTALKTTPRQEEDSTLVFEERLAYTYQLLIARKLSPSISLQIMPTVVHKNRVESFDENDQYAIGIGGRVKLTNRTTLNAEYYYRLNAPDNSPYVDAIAIGVDIETGGHVFQLHLTNSIMTIERSFITENTDEFFDGDIHFGFNISRTFQLSR